MVIRKKRRITSRFLLYVAFNSYNFVCLIFLFLILSSFLFLKQPRMKQYDKALITVLKFEEQGGDVIEIKGKELRDELSYKLSAKRVYCPTCYKPTDGVIGTKLTCATCGKTFIVS